MFRTEPDNDDPTLGSPMEYGVRAVKTGTVWVPALILAFLAVTAIGHLLASTSTSRSARSTMRWTEYAVSAPLMIVAIALLSGERMVPQLVLLAASTSVLMWFGYLADGGRVPLAQTSSAGFFLLLAVLGTVAYCFATHIEDGEAPKWLYAILISQTILFASFGVWQLAAKSSPRIGPKTEEVGFITLSLTSKLLLSGLVASGLLV